MDVQVDTTIGRKAIAEEDGHCCVDTFLLAMFVVGQWVLVQQVKQHFSRRKLVSRGMLGRVLVYLYVVTLKYGMIEIHGMFFSSPSRTHANRRFT